MGNNLSFALSLSLSLLFDFELIRIFWRQRLIFKLTKILFLCYTH